MNDPLVSVVMPVYNSEKYLAAAIDSIIAQTFDDFELILVDDASTDGSGKILRAYADRDDRIRLLQLAQNKEEAAARNHGIALARGKYIAAMDSDDISLPERLQMQLNCLEANHSIGGVGVGTEVVNEELTPIFVYPLPECHALIVFSMVVGGYAITRASLMVRRKYLVDGLAYDPAYRTSSDFELFLRLVWEKRIRYVNLAPVQYIYRLHESSVTQSRLIENSPTSSTAMRRALELLWGEVPKGAFCRFNKVEARTWLGWSEMSRARRDMTRVIDSMINAHWVDADDRQLLLNEMNRRLERTTPRRWQMFMHWKRHRFGR